MPAPPSCADLIAAAVAHIGPRLAHVTAAGNLPHIREHGLLPAAEVARQAGIDPADIALRKDRRQVGAALLNHQRPLTQNLKAARMRLTDHSPLDWAMQLDTRVYFCPERHLRTFQASFELDTGLLWLDTAQLFATCLDRIDLCALNSGSFRQVTTAPHAPSRDRTLAIYRPLSEGIDAFRAHRQKAGLRRGKDNVKEVSLRGALDAATLASVSITL